MLHEDRVDLVEQDGRVLAVDLAEEDGLRWSGDPPRSPDHVLEQLEDPLEA